MDHIWLVYQKEFLRFFVPLTKVNPLISVPSILSLHIPQTPKRENGFPPFFEHHP